MDKYIVELTSEERKELSELLMSVLLMELLIIQVLHV
jgi:hypothetical protein